jgi:diguanylate cyclase (GGDEF)-like protein
MNNSENTSPLLLIVDDDQSTRMLLRTVLKKQGYRIIEATNGQEAVALYQDEHPWIILMDVIMPIMDGFTACKEIRHDDPEANVPIIMLTGADDLNSINQAFDAGATDFITKPINWTLLTQRVRYALRTAALNRELQQNRLRQDSARRLAKLLFWEWNLKTDQLVWTDDPEVIKKIFGVYPGTVEEFFLLIHARDREKVRTALTLVRRDARKIDIELRLRVDLETKRVRMLGEFDKKGKHNPDGCFFGALHDMTDSLRAEARVRRTEARARRTEARADYLALHDSLTNLANRALFIQSLKDALFELESSELLCVAWIDLTRFHRHNDFLGEQLCDRLLCDFASRLMRYVAQLAATARLGGDEFGVLWRAKSEQDARTWLEDLLNYLAEPFVISGRDVFLTYTIGVSCCPSDAQQADPLLALARERQRQARVQSKTLIWKTGQDLPHQPSDTWEMERLLHRALERKQFFLHYQPQMDLRTGKIIGVEALLRWQHPDHGLISPGRFIPLLEETGLIERVGDWVIMEASKQCYTWTQTLKENPLRVAINLSPRQFLAPSLAQRIHAILDETGAPPALIELEITESLAMQQPKKAIEVLETLQAHGLKIAIDDFGIGHSSLEYLLSFPINAIKIDRAFVMHITDKLGNRAIVRAVAAIGQTLGLGIIAEGVETLRQCDFLEALGATEIQGFLIGKPMAPEAINTLIGSGATQFKRPGA